MNLLFAINQNFVQHLCTCLCSVIKNGGEEHYDAYILHSDLGSDEMDAILKYANDKVNCHFIHIDKNIFSGFPESKRYPQQIYYRLAAPLLLPENVHRILYLDVDLVVINPLRELYNMKFEENYYIACTHVKSFLTKINQLRLGVDDNIPYINTGVLLMDVQSIRNDLTLEKLRVVSEEKLHTFLLPDQDLITMIYGNKIKLVDTLLYNLSDRILGFYNADPRNEKIDLDWVKKNTVIIHYCGKNRPWKENYKGILDIFYHAIIKESCIQ